MCLVWVWKDGSFVSMMEPALSFQILVVLCGCPRSVTSFCSHSASFIVWQLAIYSASQVDVDTVDCLLELHEISLLPRENAKPEVDHWVSKHLAKSASAQPTRVMGLVPPRMSRTLHVPIRYHMTHCRAVQCLAPGSAEN